MLFTLFVIFFYPYVTCLFLSLFAYPLCCIFVLAQAATFRKTIFSVKKDLLLQAPYSPYLGLTQNIAYIGGLATTFMNYGYIILGIIIIITSNSGGDSWFWFVIPVMVAELSQTAMYMTAALLSRDYLPKSGSSCATLATNWEYSSAGYPTIFQVLAEVDTVKTRDERFFCDLMVRNYRFEFALGVIGMARSATVVAFAIYVMIDMIWSDSWHLRSKTRFLSRWLAKRREWKRQAREMRGVGVVKVHLGVGNTVGAEKQEQDLESGNQPAKNVPMPPILPPLAFQTSGTISGPLLVKLVEDTSILASLAQNLHHSDLLNLGLACKSVHTSLTAINKSVPLRTLSCHKGSKSSCFACGAQMCAFCLTSRGLPPTDVSSHFRRCTPYCSSCFYAKFCRVSSKEVYRYSRYSSHTSLRTVPTWLKPVGCNCRRVDKVGASVARDLCPNCAKRTAEENVKSREKREKEEMRHLEMQSLVCAGTNCQRRIEGSGARWWGCGTCGGECVESGVHLSWVGKEDR